MATHEKRMLDREAVRSVIQQWNANRLDLFALSEPDENLLFHGVMRFYFQDAGQKVATKCIRVASDATVSDVIETLIEKFRPDMRMLSLPNYALYEVHANGEERKLNPDEKPLLVQLNWHIDDREGRFLLRNVDQKNSIESADTNFKRKLSKREKKEQKKREKLAKLNSDGGEAENHVAEKLYTELPETSFTRSISNPEAVMRRRRQQKLEKKLQQFRSKDGGPDTGGTLKIYGESLCRDVPYKTLLLSIRDCAQAVVREMLSKYGLDKADPLHYCLVQVNSDGTEYILDDDECPLSILMNHPTSRGSIMFHVRRRPADSQPRRRKKKPLGVSNGSNSMLSEREGPMLVEVTHSGDGGRRIKLGSDPVEVGSANTNTLQLFGPSIQARHCLISLLEGVCTVTPLHADALTFVNGHHIQQPTVLHNGSVVMFGRVASYRFVDSPSDGRYNLALSQSQLDSACLYESRSPISPSWNEEDRALSPINSLTQGPMQGSKQSFLDTADSALSQSRRTDFEKIHHNSLPSMLSTEDKGRNSYLSQPSDGIKSKELDMNFHADIDGNGDNETKSISSNKSSGSNQETRHPKMPTTSASDPQGGGQEPILPAVLEFPETHQENFLRQVITELDVNIPTFKLSPVYTLYLCARYRASTHYRPDLQPTERAHKLTIFLHHVANLIFNVVQDQYTDPRILAFWMANSSEFLHFLKSDRHISAFSVQAQEVLAESVQTAFRNLVNCFRVELSQTLNQFLSENIDHDSAAGLVLTVLGSAMALLRRCRVNAALTIQLFSQLFHYINVICFNTIVANSHMCTAEWGKVMTERLQLLELWAERQGLELAADCHLAKINQCAQFLQAPKTTVEEVQQLACSCFRLNSLQMAALLQQEKIPRNLADTAIRMAESVADELTRADGREVRLEESPELHLALLLPDDGFSCDVVRGIPSGLVDFLNPLQGAGMCRLAAQPTSIGLWTVYMHQFNVRSPSAMSNKLPQPEVQVIKLHKNSNGMGLSIVAAKGAGQERLGIYIKSVVPGGAADADGRLQAGDQLLRVDGQSLIGITQERAADYLVRTGPVVTLEVAKQGAIYHGLATLLQQPSPIIQRGNRRMSERDLSRMGADVKTQMPTTSNQHLPNSKSVPALHHVGNLGMSNKSRSIHNLANNNEQGFYQNLSVYRAQNQSHPTLGERPPLMLNQQSTINAAGGAMTMPTTTTNLSNQSTVLSRPVSAYYNSNNTLANTMPSSSSMSYITNTPQGTLNNTMNENISNNNQPQYQTMQIGNRMKGNNGFMRENQTQQSLRMNQMMAPSMPNIANSSGYPTNMSSSQSMQNVNMIPGSQQELYHHNAYMGNNNSNMMLVNDHQQRMSGNQTLSHLRGQAKMAEMGEMLNRRNQRQDQGITSMDLQTHNQLTSSGMPHANMMASTMNRHNVSMSNSQAQQMSPIKQLPPTAPKPQIGRQPLQPPYQPGPEESSPPLPPSATHPLYKTNTLTSGGSINYIASSLDPPKVAYYPVASNQSQPGKNFIGGNPWEREEREKEHELRREQVRQWRDQQIVELSALLHRTPQQEEQLKTLVLERDFERRALEVEDQEDDNETSYSKDNVQEVIRLSNQPLPTPVTSMKQIDIRNVPPPANQNQQHSPPNSETSRSTPPMAEAQQSFQGYPIQQSQIVPTPTVQPKSILKNNRYDGPNINTPSSPSKSHKSTSFADERRLLAEHAISQLSKDMSNVNLSAIENDTSTYTKTSQSHPETNDHKLHLQQFQPKESPSDSYSQNNSVIAAPPPPPERNSSYVVMSQQQKYRSNNLLTAKPPIASPSLEHTMTAKRPPLNLLTNNNNTVTNMLTTTSVINNSNIQQTTVITNTTISSGTSTIGRDGKRVSFHDEENNFVPPQEFIGDKGDLNMIREDPDKFLEETTAILQTPTTPETEMWNTSVQHTPGVIGAQEVYRDPRQRRLQEQQQKQQQKSGDGVPEKLSFKEKMKMFALESGEDQTPKDKLKISRAQRDIDAVH